MISWLKSIFRTNVAKSKFDELPNIEFENYTLHESSLISDQQLAPSVDKVVDDLTVLPAEALINVGSQEDNVTYDLDLHLSNYEYPNINILGLVSSDPEIYPDFQIDLKKQIVNAFKTFDIGVQIKSFST